WHTKQNTSAAASRYRSFTFVLLIQTTVRKQMSESQDPLDANEVARWRALASEYETKLTDAASLVARVRHEINNPLAALLGQAQLLLREDLPEKTRKRAETIESQAKRIEEIVSELRAIQIPVAASQQQRE